MKFQKPGTVALHHNKLQRSIFSNDILVKENVQCNVSDSLRFQINKIQRIWTSLKVNNELMRMLDPTKKKKRKKDPYCQC